MGVFANHDRYLHFTEIDGLPRNITTCLTQDQYGYIWIGTNNGIARFDGKDFYCYEELSKIGIVDLLYDTKHNLWAATDKGLYKYNRLTNFFEIIAEGYVPEVHEDLGQIYFLMSSDIYKVKGNLYFPVYSGNDVTDFCFSRYGLWVSKGNNGVFLIKRGKEFNEVISSFLENKEVAQISKIYENILVGLFNGQVFLIDANKQTRKINIKNHYFLKEASLVNNEIWLATDGNGIIILDKKFNFSRILSRSNSADESIYSNSIYDILPDKNGEIWLASYGAGLTCILSDNLLFQNILPRKGNQNSLVANEGVSVTIREPLVFFGTNYGLSQWNMNNNKFINLSSEKLKSELKGSKVTAIDIDINGNIWVAAYDGLLGKYSPRHTLIETFNPCRDNPNEMQQIVGLKKVNKKNLLIHTQYYTHTLLNFDTENKKIRKFELYEKGSNITYYLLNSLRLNRQGELLAVISDLGLFHVNWVENVLENRLSDLNSRINHAINDFHQDSTGLYWITSPTDGLLCISQHDSIIRNWTVKDGLSSNSLVRIESVCDRYLWISSISGICRFDTKTGEILNFNHRDGLPANEFQNRVSATFSDGRIVFGSHAGFTIIDPSKVNSDTLKTKVVISDITFQNQSIRNPKGEQFLEIPLEKTKEITLPFHKNSFSIHFFTKNKSFSKFHSYSYRLLGLEDNWNYQGETNYTTYTNLSPGKYIFEIKSADNTQPGITSRLILRIKPPWYLSWYAYVIYIILLILIIYLSIYALHKRFELLKEKEISDFKIRQEHELTEKKLAFFTNVSHDLKTPLTLIDAPVNDLLQSNNLSTEQKNKLMMVNRNSKRLYNLINDLLDFRQITQKKAVLKVRETSIFDIIDNIYNSFKEDCKHKNLTFAYSVEKNHTSTVDVEKIEKILWNLVSNAIKFSKQGGSIQIIAKKTMKNNIDCLKLVVSDEGIGINANKITKIFDRFYKIESSNTYNKKGTGIGLSIVKELVELHHGDIQVESTRDLGTTFIIVIPSANDYYTKNEAGFIDTPKVDIYSLKESINTNSPKFEEITKKQYNLPGILIVEDNLELREYLTGHFKKTYKVFQAEDAIQGLTMAKEIHPDFILTDVEMPNMNGYEFCKEIRKEFDTSHIPILMLTANSAVNQQIEGLSTGADVYMTKPFEIKLLDAQISSLLENRKSIRKKIKGIETPENLEKTLPDKDVQFIKNLRLFIEENIMVEDLSVQLLSNHFSVSLAQLHRKIKALTGATPNNIIKTMRLKKAYKLIKEDGLRVSEAAFQTGFNDPNYFTTCFRKEFGENPSQVISR